MTHASWPPWDVTSLQVKLGALAERLEQRKELEEDVVGWLSRLLVIRSAGYLEQVAFVTCRAFVDAKSGGLVRSYAKSHLERTRNPSPDNLLQLVGRFDHGLENDLSSFLDDNDQHVRRELSFLVDRRNRIAHGESESVNPQKALALKGVACDVADWFVLRMNPH